MNLYINEIKLAKYKIMKTKLFSLFIFAITVQFSYAQQSSISVIPSKADQEIINLSSKKWQWMSQKNADSLSVLFNDKCDFVHMGGTWGKSRELDIIKGGFIWYKKAEVYNAEVKFFGNTAIILSDIDLVAVVGSNDAINPFMVTEVFVKENGKWSQAQLTFSHLARPLKLKKE